MTAVLSGLDLEVPQHQFLVVLILRCYDRISYWSWYWGAM